MAADRVLDNGNLRLTFRKTARETSGAWLEMDAVYRPNAPRPVAHFHPRQEETFEVLEGTLHFGIAGKERVLSKGERLVIPAGTVHQAWNPSAQEARMLWIVRPALRTQRFFETVYGLASDGKTKASGTPHLLQAALLARAYRQEFVAARPPLLVQNCVFACLTPLARLLGYGEYYPRYAID